jgi:PAS domain S-box-containing protein
MTEYFTADHAVRTADGRLVHQHDAFPDITDDAPHLKSALSTAESGTLYPVSMLSTAELSRRPRRAPDYEAENRALVTLAREMAASPEDILQKLADAALNLCEAHSAGLSLLEDGDQKKRFHWRAIAGRWSPYMNGGTPREFGPCGTVLDRNIAMICSHPERDFPYWSDVTPVLEEGLLIPFYIQGEALGTIWIVAHDTSRRFDSEDLRVMTNLGTFAAAAYQTLLSVAATERIASIVESSDDAIVSKGLDGIITSWNKGAERIFGYTSNDVIGKPITILIPPDRQQEEDAILERIRRGQRIEHFEAVRVRKDGSRVDISVTVSPIKSAQGKIVGASKIAQDITERKQSQAQIAILAREAEHRAKNVLATVQATVHLSQSDTPEGLKKAIQGRIQALSNVHRLFVDSRWTGAELHDLVTQELLPYRQEAESRLRIVGPNLLLEPSTAQTIAVTLHELATNAAKYGSLSVPNGHVHVDWSCVADGPLALHWTETGGPLVKPPTRRGFGTRVIERMICDQLNGEVHFDWPVEGFACEITLPTSNGGHVAAPGRPR